MDEAKIDEECEEEVETLGEVKEEAEGRSKKCLSECAPRHELHTTILEHSRMEHALVRHRL